jgi:hypothetical protein
MIVKGTLAEKGKSNLVNLAKINKKQTKVKVKKRAA